METNAHNDPLSAFDRDDQPPTNEDGEAPTQATNHPSQPSQTDNQLWGYLQPMVSHPKLDRLDFWRLHASIKIGRNPQLNDFHLPGFKVSNQHCMIRWDGEESGNGVIVHDFSSNGTYINKIKIGKGNSVLIRDGNEIAFGIPIAQPDDGGREDYRYIFRHLAKTAVPKDGLHAYYDISEALGSGSFATVYKAIYKSTGEWYAIKMIKAKHGHGTGTRNNIDLEAAARKAYAREVDIMKRLQHANICELKEVFWQGADISLVLELVSGGDLLEHILTKGGLTEAETLDISYQLCDALAYCHLEGVTHRDLKPENVLLTKDTPPRIKVADFGLAKVVDSVTMLRTMCGTPSYLAPEVVLQTEHAPGYDELVDAWSVGVMIFSMLTNATPFIEDEEQTELRIRIAHRTIAWQFLPKNISDHCTHFMGRLLEFNPKKRMGLRHSMRHPWLINYVPSHDNSDWKSKHEHPNSSSSGNANRGMDAPAHGPYPEPEDDNVTVRSSSVEVDSCMENLHLDPADPNHMPHLDGEDELRHIPGSYVSGSIKAPLVRRSEARKRAKEQGKAIVEPSPEMYARAAGDNINGAGPSNHVNANKRGHSELTPLSEDEEEGTTANEDTTETAVRHSPRKRGRPASNTPAEPKPAGRGRGKGRGTAAARGAKAKAIEPPIAAVRRSARTAPR